jgi:hypothetical protein
VVNWTRLSRAITFAFILAIIILLFIVSCGAIVFLLAIINPTICIIFVLVLVFVELVFFVYLILD